jgi:hypothetical protein
MLMEGKTWKEASGLPDLARMAEIREQREAEKRREAILAAYRDRNPGCCVPDWAIDTTDDYPSAGI